MDGAGQGAFAGERELRGKERPLAGAPFRGVFAVVVESDFPDGGDRCTGLRQRVHLLAEPLQEPFHIAGRGQRIGFIRTISDGRQRISGRKRGGACRRRIGARIAADGEESVQPGFAGTRQNCRCVGSALFSGFRKMGVGIKKGHGGKECYG